MVNLTVAFYEVGGPADDPFAVRTATLVADEAEVQLGVDENGRTSVEEDKEMRVRRAVLETTDRARVRNLVLKLDEALALVTEGGIRLYTPDDLHPFELTVGGDQPLEITGNGLQAWLPGRESLPGDAVRIEVANNPELIQTTSSGVTHLQARGKLSYREDRDGGAVILMEDQVRITMDGESFGPGQAGSEGGDPLSATGRRLRAQLAHYGLVSPHFVRRCMDRPRRFRI